jgi:Cof subfamily protein (haloacid dehalogenase superfamily)
MSRIALVVSDVDGTLVTHDKRLTEGARRAVRRLHDAGIGFTITSSRPPVGMRFFVEPLGITLPVGPFNGSSMLDPRLGIIEQHLIAPETARRSIELLDQFGVDIWLFTNDQWIIRRDDGKYVPHERATIQFDPDLASDFGPWITNASKIVGVSADPVLLERCERAMQETLGNRASAVRSQSYYVDVTPPGHDKGTFVEAMARRLNVPLHAIATIGDMQNDLAMFKVSGLSIAMGNATDHVKQQAKHVTASNDAEGFAGAVDIILENNLLYPPPPS